MRVRASCGSSRRCRQQAQCEMAASKRKEDLSFRSQVAQVSAAVPRQETRCVLLFRLLSWDGPLWQPRSFASLSVVESACWSKLDARSTTGPKRTLPTALK